MATIVEADEEEKDNMSTTTSTTKNNTILFRISRYRAGKNSVYRVVAYIPGFSPTYLVKPEGDNNFPNRSAALKACKRRAISLGYVPEIVTGAVTRSRAATA